MSRPLGLRAAAACAPALVACLLAAAPASANLTGSIQTSALSDYRVGAAKEPTEACTVVNANTKYGSKQAVYLNGGPNSENGGSGLPDGSYYVKVTDPSGADLLGTSAGTPTPRPISATGGGGGGGVSTTTLKLSVLSALFGKVGRSETETLYSPPVFVVSR